MIGCEPVHVKHGEMYPGRGFHRNFSFHGFQMVGRLFIPEGLQVLSRGKWIELIFNKIKISAPDFHGRHWYHFLFGAIEE